jgi:hypothetical protein
LDQNLGVDNRSSKENYRGFYEKKPSKAFFNDGETYSAKQISGRVEKPMRQPFEEILSTRRHGQGLLDGNQEQNQMMYFQSFVNLDRGH